MKSIQVPCDASWRRSRGVEAIAAYIKRKRSATAFT